VCGAGRIRADSATMTGRARSPAPRSPDVARQAGQWTRRQRWSWAGFVGALLVVSGIVAWQLTARPASRPDVVFVLVDTLRSDRLGVYGSQSGARTPVMDRLAAGSILYERAYAPSSWTLPSIASIFMGQPPHEHGVFQFLVHLPGRSPTMAEVLRDAGYETAAFIANTAIGSNTGHDRGFDEFEVLESPELATNATAYVQAEGVIARALGWLDARSRRDRPFFLYLHFMDPHAPYAVHPGITPERSADVGLSDEQLNLRAVFGSHVKNDARRASYWRLSPQEKARVGQLYDGEVSYFDQQLGTLLAGLAERGILDGAIVVLTGDHGEELGEHDLYGHGITLFQPELRVPLMIKLPRGERSGRVRRLVQTTGIGATLFREGGIPRPRSFTAEAVPLADEPRHADAVESEMQAVDGVYVAPHRRVRVEDTRKAFETANGSLLVTDLATDPSELALHSPSDAAELTLVATLRASGATDPSRGAPASATIDPTTRRRLEALGYVVPDRPDATPPRR
jgi:arylsulfatase A-like enzyme